MRVPTQSLHSIQRLRVRPRQAVGLLLAPARPLAA